ncbi:MAG: GIY-YIG nuclease family protein [Proteobacteria bacterium]|nr:GIY-YIG nuclease family protein [Pseudomonadota bacterium]
MRIHMEKGGYVYILASRRNGTLYIGVTTNLAERIWLHRQGMGSAFTKKYNVTRLVFWETHADIDTAIRREKAMKEWRRNWKLLLIEKINPNWDDLWHSISGSRLPPG